MFQQILVPLDGSAVAEAVLPHATLIAKAFGARLVLMGVVDLGGTEAGEGHQAYLTQVAERAQGEVRKYLDGVAAKLRGEGVEAQSEVTIGRAAEALANFAPGHVELIAMSTHGRSGIGRWMFGSVTDRVLHLTAVPMLIIRAQEKGTPAPATLKSVILPLDGSPLAESALPYARAAALQLKLPLTLLRAVHMNAVAMGEADGFSAYAGDMLAAMEAEAADYLAGVSSGLQGEGITCETRVLSGSPAAVLVDFAQARPDSLVVISTHGRSGIGRAVLGSVADRMVKASGDAVLVIRPQLA